MRSPKLPPNVWSPAAIRALAGLTVGLLSGATPGITAQPVIVCFGDSTTVGQRSLQAYSVVLGPAIRRDFGREVTVVNAGVRGDTTQRAAERFAKDVLARKPQLVVLQFGINDSAVDVWKNPPAIGPRVERAEYRANLLRFIMESRRAGAQVVLMTPNPLRWAERTRELYGRPPYDRDDPDGFNLHLRDYARIMREVAEKTGTPLVDVMAAHDEAARAGGEPLLGDGMHPNQAGHQLVCDLLVALLRSRPELLGTGPPESAAARD